MKSCERVEQNREARRATNSIAVVMAVALAGAVGAAPANAQDGGEQDRFEEAHSLRSLDIMLMVTSLRCRSGPHDFQSDYHRFSAAHSPHLTAASRTLKRSFAATYGEANPARALDRMGVRIANSYGDGHPWLSCAELQQTTRDLAQSMDPNHLASNARYLLSAARPQQAPMRGNGEGEPVRLGYNMTAVWEQRP